MTAYAAGTKVGIDQTRSEIEKTLTRFGADRFAYFGEKARAIIVFEAHGRAASDSTSRSAKATTSA
jgi:hypothetical protein